LIFIPLTAVFQEATNPGGIINDWVRDKVYDQGYMREYMKEHHTPFSSEVEECDFNTMTPKDFFHKHVKTHTPCLFRGYAKTQKAYTLWQNETYLKETAGDEIIWAEK